MVWNEKASLRGPQGPQGLAGPQGIQGPIGPKGDTGPQGPAGVMTKVERQQLFGASAYTEKTFGSLVWSGPWYNPGANVFTRLRATSDGRLIVERSVNGAAGISGNDPYLYAPTSGMYLLHATQTFGNDQGARGLGLGTSLTSGESGMYLWQDYTFGLIINATTLTYLPAGTKLYPWVWTPINSGMSGDNRGIRSRYSISWVGP